jgi:signal transduction histidine kinase
VSSVLERLRRAGADASSALGVDPSPDGSDPASLERFLARELRPSRWIGWRLRLLLTAALAGCIGIFLLARTLGQVPFIQAQWNIDTLGQVELVRSDLSMLHEHEDRILVAITGRDGDRIPVTANALQRSGRWIVEDGARQDHVVLHQKLHAALTQGTVWLSFADGSVASVRPRALGLAGLGAAFWLLAAFAMGLYLVAMVVVLVRPSLPNVLYSLMALCQSSNLMLIAVESTFELAIPPGFLLWDGPARMSLDLVTAAAIAHAAAVHPRRLPGAAWLATACWLLVGTLATLAMQDRLQQAWWWTQATGALLGLLTIGLLSWSHRLEPHPLAVVVRRFGVVSTGTWLLLTLAVASAVQRPDLQHHIAGVGSVIWYVFFAALLLVVPFLSGTQQLGREFLMLAAVSTVATSLDLLFVAVFSLGQFASLTLSMFLALGVYAGVRQWILNQMLGTSMVTAERMFEQLYRIAREVEVHPESLPTQLMRLLRELFEPLEVVPLDRAAGSARVVADGSTLLVPVPDLDLDAEENNRPRSIALRFARRGRRLFTLDDARLTERVVEQLRRAIAYDRAVERGRSEERSRLAQDLHDDIGARLLTLMYKAPNPEMEDYVRYTLQDLKTLTRGLAASTHRLSHAIAEWKADLTQRLTAAQCDLGWATNFDRDIVLSVVQWSALTRVLRELVSNSIAHAGATRVDVSISFEHDRLDVTVSDNGAGRNPQAWSHGLGLGGVRKRVKQLGGDVEWRENLERGITCHVRILEFSKSSAGPAGG